MRDSSRARLFWLGCLPVRTLLGVGGVLLPPLHRGVSIAFAAYSGVTAVVFSYHAVRHLCGSNRKGGFGGRIWWHDARYVHIALWLSASVLFALDLPGGWLLVADAAAGFVFGVLHHACGVWSAPG